MFAKYFLGALVAIASVRADVVPTAPGPGDIFNEGSECTIEWTADTTGTWKVLNIELMTGSNLGMVHLTTVATLDGTDPALSPYKYTCPQVTPNSAIYFYQFSTPAAPTKNTWTTRFTIAGADGSTTPPTNANQPGAGGAAIPWGTGQLVNPADAVPAPGAGNSTAAPATTAPATTTAAPNTTAPVTSRTTTSTSSTASNTTTATSTASAAGANFVLDSKVWVAGVALFAAFTSML